MSITTRSRDSVSSPGRGSSAAVTVTVASIVLRPSSTAQRMVREAW